MNAKNAQALGRKDGRTLQITTSLSQEEYIQHGITVASMETNVLATRKIYADAWANAWVEPTVEAPAPHNTSRFGFCCCAACCVANPTVK